MVSGPLGPRLGDKAPWGESFGPGPGVQGIPWTRASELHIVSMVMGGGAHALVTWVTVGKGTGGGLFWGHRWEGSCRASSPGVPKARRISDGHRHSTE